MIVTLEEPFYRNMIDIDIPEDTTVKKAISELVTFLNERYGRELQVEDVALIDNRLDLILPNNKTFAEIGVWNGDYLTLYRHSIG